jgi:hypothetical protein
MKDRSIISKQNQRNWWMDAFLFVSALLAGMSGIYFLYFPIGGYQGGRNPAYGLSILFDRSTWDVLHTWGGVAMIVIAIIHLVIHWPWVMSMTRWLGKVFRRETQFTGRGGFQNLLLNTVIALSFIVTTFSGVYFLFFPGGQGNVDPMILFMRSTWDIIHTWAGVTLMSAGIFHFIIHWRWIVKVTEKMVQSIPLKKSEDVLKQSNMTVNR